jgi:putative ABC transport system ATP-binding protein
MIEVFDVRKVFSGGKPNEFTALHGITLSVEARRVTVLKGPSGSGKTTLLSILGCMARPTAGRVNHFGREVTSLPERFLTEIRQQTIGFIFQQFHLIRGLTCLENVMLPAYPTGEKHAVMRGRAVRLLEMLEVSSKAMAKVEWLSGGEAGRVAIARALINEPTVVIADEPTAHLDTKLSGDFLEIMGKLKQAGKTIIIASHDPLVVDSAIVDAVVEMRDGTIVAGGAGP